MSSMKLMALGGAWAGAMFLSANILSNWLVGRDLLLVATIISTLVIILIARVTPESK